MVVKPMIYLYAIEMKDEQYEEDIFSLLDHISEEKRKRVKRFINRIDQKRGILGEVLLRYLLRNHYGIEPKDISFQYNEYGKPFLVRQNSIYFNISHSGEWIFCGVSDVPIGIDVEGGKAEVQSIAKRFFSESENTYIEHQLLPNQQNAFYKIWTLKESYVKCVGKGLQIPLDSFRFDFSDEKIRMYVDGVLDSNYLFRSQKISEKYYMALCVMGDAVDLWENAIKKISVRELIHSMCLM